MYFNYNNVFNTIGLVFTTPICRIRCMSPLARSGWIDDGVFMQKDGSGGSRGRNMVWNNFGGNTPHHAFTTGRPHPQRSLDGGSATGGSGSGMSGGFAPNKVRPKGPSQTLKMINVSVCVCGHVCE